MKVVLERIITFLKDKLITITTSKIKYNHKIMMAKHSTIMKGTQRVITLMKLLLITKIQ